MWKKKLDDKKVLDFAWTYLGLLKLAAVLLLLSYLATKTGR